MRIKLNEHLRIKLNGYLRIKLNGYLRIKLNEYLCIELNEYLCIELNEYLRIKLNKKTILNIATNGQAWLTRINIREYIHTYNILFIHANLINIQLFFMRGVLTNYIIKKYKKLHEGYKGKQVGEMHRRKKGITKNK